jgi:hypothetical protein
MRVGIHDDRVWDRSPVTLFVVLVVGGPLAVPVGAAEPCRIEVIERASGWPVPLVELRTLHGVRLVTDNAGVVALDLPELMGRESWFEVHGHGYAVPADGFGFRGVRLTPRRGQTLRVEVQREIIAKRVGRLTGAGLLAESEKLGAADSSALPIVLGSDSVQNALHRGRLFWLWGDTTLPRYPLGIFHCTGAFSDPQPLASIKPPLRAELNLIRDEQGRPRAIAQLPGRGPTWLTACASLPDRHGRDRLVATYMKVDPPLSVWQWGLCAWDEEKGEFHSLRVLWSKDEEGNPPSMPRGHASFWNNEAGQRFVQFGNPFPTLRCPAEFESWRDPNTWESLQTPAKLTAHTGDPVTPHSGSIAWNDYRDRWVTVFVEKFGKPSALGEVWYAEAETPTGPWGPAVKILSHDRYSFYNPCLHAGFVPHGSPHLFFEGTFSVMFSGNDRPTPRYDYNQILYRLDLDDPSLAPAFGGAL